MGVIERLLQENNGIAEQWHSCKVLHHYVSRVTNRVAMAMSERVLRLQRVAVLHCVQSAVGVSVCPWHSPHNPGSRSPSFTELVMRAGRQQPSVAAALVIAWEHAFEQL